MDLSPLQRKAAFAVIVLVLAGLGWYLLLPAIRGTASPAGRPAGPRSAAAPAPGRSPAAATSGVSPPVPPASTSPASGPSPAASPDIYRWLPFSPSGLAAASGVAIRFTRAYSTFSYTQDAAEWLATMNGLMTRTLGQQLTAAYNTPGVASARTRQRQVASGTASVSALRAFGSSSITFLMASTQHLTDTRGRSQASYSYAVTVTQAAGDWQVSSIELASAGNS